MEIGTLLVEVEKKLQQRDLHGAGLYVNMVEHELSTAARRLADLKQVLKRLSGDDENVAPAHGTPKKAAHTDVKGMLDANNHNIELLKKPAGLSKMPSHELRSEMGLSHNQPGSPSHMREDERFKNVINKVRKSYKIIRREGEEGIIHLVQVYLLPPIYMVKHFLSANEAGNINSNIVNEWKSLNLSLKEPTYFFSESQERECELVYKRLAAFVPYGFDERGILSKCCISQGHMPKVVQLEDSMKEHGGYIGVIVIDSTPDSDTRLDFINLGFQANCEPGLLIFAQIDKFSEGDIFGSVLLSVKQNSNTRATILTLQVPYA